MSGRLPLSAQCGRRTTRGKTCTRQRLLWWHLPYRQVQEMRRQGTLPISCISHLTDEERALYEKVQRDYEAARAARG